MNATAARRKRYSHFGRLLVAGIVAAIANGLTAHLAHDTADYYLWKATTG